MSDHSDALKVTLTIPTDESDVTINVQGDSGQTITEQEVVYYLFQSATTIMGHMTDEQRAQTITLIEGFFE